MVDIHQLKVNTKYYVTINIPYNIDTTYNLRVVINELHPSSTPDAVDYVQFKTIKNSGSVIPQLGYTNVSMPSEWILNSETLYGLLNGITLDDIIFLIDQYV